MGGTIQKPLAVTGTVSTVVGAAGAAGAADGPMASARFNYLHGITSDGGNLYITDQSNGTIRKVVIATGAVSTIAGTAGASGSADGTGAAARFYLPEGITTDGTNLYVADRNNCTIRKIVIATGAVSTLAGNPAIPGAADGAGTVARFNDPNGITTDGKYLYVTDKKSNTIRKVAISTGTVTTLAGKAGESGSADGAGAAARFTGPAGITTDGKNLYVADQYSYSIRKIVIATGAVTTLAGKNGVSGKADGTGAAAQFSGPAGITTDGANLYVTESLKNTVRKVVIATGAVTTLSGSEGAAAAFKTPKGITSDGTYLYVADYGNQTVKKIK